MLGVTRQAAQHKYAPMLVDTPLEGDDGEASESEESQQRLRSVSTVLKQAGRQPNLVAHADWSTDPKKRWCAIAVRGDDGRYRADAPELVGDVDTYFDRLRARVGASATVLAGFDFPIGLPARYAAKVGFTDFRTALSKFGRDEWHDFYEPARSRSEISISRPFYPYAAGRKGEHRQEYLYSRLGLDDMSHLKRRCEHRAQSLFWLIGGNQVGKAAISGWRDLLAPAMGSNGSLTIWPFDGPLGDLLAQPGIVVTETYPADTCRHLGLPVSEPKRSKRCQADRAAGASTIRAWTDRNAVRLTDRLEREIEDGFGRGGDGEDPFDAASACSACSMSCSAISHPANLGTTRRRSRAGCSASEHHHRLRCSTIHRTRTSTEQCDHALSWSGQLPPQPARAATRASVKWPTHWGRMPKARVAAPVMARAAETRWES